MSRSRHGASLATLLAVLVIASGCKHDVTPPPPPPPSKPTIVLSASTIDFTGMAGTADPAQQTIDVMASVGALSGLTTRVVYASDQPGDWLDASLNGSASPAKLILRPKLASLAVQSYSATVEISAPNADNSPRQVAVTLHVSAPPAIVPSRTNVVFTATRNRSSPPPETVTISNGGGGVLDGLTASVAYDNGQPTGWLTPSLSGPTAPATLTLSAATGNLAAGNHTASVTLKSTSAGATPQTISVRFDVGGLPCIALSQSSLTTRAVAGGANPAPISLAITNATDGVLSGLAIGVAYESGQPTGWLAAALDQSTAPTMLTLQPNVGGLAPGSYVAAVSVSSPVACNSPMRATVTFTVDAPPIPPRIVLSSTLAQFTASTANPADVAIGISNGGGGTLSGLSAEISYPSGSPSGWLNALVSSASAPATLSLRAALGSLGPGTYSAQVSVKAAGASNSPQVVAVAFTVIAPSVPAIGLSRSSLGFAALQGAPAPAAQAVAIENAGSGTLNGLSATVTYAAGEPAGWAMATLSQTAAPSTLSVRVLPGTLSPGTYHAAIAIAASGAANSPQVVMVTLIIDRAPAIRVLYSSISFISIVGGADPQAKLADIENGGGGTLDGLAVAVTYAGGEPTGWMTVSINRTTAPATITLQPRTGALAVGVYHASLTISSPAASNSPITVQLGFAINPAPVIQLFSSTAAFTMVSGGPNPAAARIDVANAGAGTLTDLGADVSYTTGQPTGWLHAALSSTAAPSALTLEVSAVTLAPGSYSATVTVRSSVQGVAPKTVAVSLTITPQLIPPAIGLSTDAIALSAPEGSDASGPTVSVTNSGGGTLSGLSLNVAFGAGQPTNWLGVTLDRTEAPAILSIKFASRTLPIGRYDAAITIRSSVAGVAPSTVALTLNVRQSGAVISLSATAAIFMVGQGAPSPSPQTIAITNGGTDLLSRLAARVDYTAGGSGWLVAAVGEGDLPNTTAPATLYLTPTTTSLAPGNYAATVTVFSPLQGVAAKTVSVSLTVTTVRSLSLSPTSVAFSATQAGPNPAVQTVSVNDGGNGSVTGLVVSASSYGAGQPAGWLTATLSSTATPSTLSLQPTVGSLAAGTYTATVSISSPNAANSPQTVGVTFVVASAPTQSFSLSAAASPTDAGSVSRSPNQSTYQSGTSVTLTAVPNTGWLFAGWSGDATATTSPVTVQMNGNKSVTANFGLKAPVLTAPAQSTGSVTLSWTYEWPCKVTPCLGSTSDRYELEEATSSGGPFSVVGTFARSSNATTFTKGAGTYYYRMRSLSGYGYSPYSTVTSVRVAGSSEITVYASATNGLSFSTKDATVANTVLRNGLQVGCSFSIGVDGLNARTCHSSALHFDAVQPQITGRTIARAVLKLYPSLVPTNWQTTYTVNAFASSWSESTITYKNQPGYYSGVGGTAAPPTTTALPVEFDVTAIVQNWASGRWLNNGLMLWDRSEVGPDPSDSIIQITWFETLANYTRLDRRPQLYVVFQ